MAATLNADKELVRASFPIMKWEEDPEDPSTIFVYGKATTPEIDTDDQVVSSEFSGKALQEWLESAPALRVQHNAQRDPAGSGVKVEVNRDGDGAHWVKAAVDEPTAVRLVKKGHLRAYSVGIARPVIERDVTGKARGGIIKGGRIVEVSLVDSPANRGCFLEIAKAAGDGSAEFTGKFFGGSDLLTKATGTVNVDLPETASITFSPTDLAKLLKHRDIAEQRDVELAEKRQMDPDVGGGVDRDSLPTSDFVFPDERVFPVPTPGDVSDAASSWGRYKGAKSFDEFKSKLIALARRKGAEFVAELPQSWKDEMSAKSDTEPDVAKGKKDCTSCGRTYHADAKVRNCEGCGSDLPTADDAGKAADADVEKKCKTCGGTGTIRGGQRDCPACSGGEADKATDAEAVKGGDDAPDASQQGADDGDDDGDKPDDDGDKPDDDADQDAADKPAVKAEKLPQCTSCGGDCPLDAKFCPMCGLDTAAMKALTKPSKKAAKATCTKCGMKARKGTRFCPGCGTAVGGVTKKAKKGKPVVSNRFGHRADPVSAHREPDGPAMETFEEDAGLEDGDAAAERAAARYKSSGAGAALGTLHDLTCAAFPPHGTVADAIDLSAWSEQAVKATTAGNLEEAAKALALMGHAKTLKSTDPADLAEVRRDLHKGFSDAYPDVDVTSGSVIPTRPSRPYLTDGHARPSFGQQDPNAPAKVPGQAPQADQFDRGPLTTGHADPSPSFTTDPMRPSSSNPARVYYTNSSREQARSAMLAMHDHIATTFPELCPLAGTRDDISTASKTAAEPTVAKAGESAADQPAEQPAEMTAPALDPDHAGANANEVVTKVHGGTEPDFISKADVIGLVKAHTADLIKSLGDQIGDLRAHFDDQINELRRSVEEMAAEPDPRQAPWRGVAVNKNSSNATVQPVERRSLFDEAAAARRDALVLQLQDQRLNSPHPAEREQARKALAEMLATP